MSVDSLLCEVTPNLALRPYIQAADQLYYKDQRVLSDVKAETSGQSGQQQQTSSGQGNNNKGGKKNNNEGGRNRQDSHKGGDKVRQAINEAKQTAQQARGGNGGRNRRSSNKSESGELTSIRKELEELREDNASLRKEVDELRQMILKNCNISQPCGGQKAAASAPAKKEEPKKEAAAAADDDFDLFGSEDEDDEEKKRITEERLKAYAEKKSKKPGPIAKSNIIYDVKPWDDTIKMEDIEAAVRGIEMDGLVWGASKKVPVAFGLNKLQIMCVVEDDKVSSDLLEEKICEFEDLVQSVDIVAFNKV